jgi:hypothetical protein
MVCLMVEHVLGYAIEYFRSYDIYKNGKIDINGIKRAPIETLVGNIQFFVVCLLLGFTVKHFMISPSIH